MARLLLTIVILALAQVSAFAGEYLCSNLSIDDGLSQNYVTAIARDHRGFLWIGTRFGLNRYDFVKVSNYYYNPSDASSAPDNIIQELYADNHGRLWVAGEKRLAMLDEKTGVLAPVVYQDKAVNVRSFYDDGDGVLIGGAGTLYYYDNATDRLSRLQTKGGSTYYYTRIHYWKPDYYILSTRWDGLWLFDRARATISRLPGCDERRIMASTVDSQGRLWVSAYGKGVFSYERDGSREHVLNSRSSALSTNLVLDIVEVNGEIWLATDGGGINIYNPALRRFADGEDSRRLRSLGSVSRLYVDRHGNVYGGTVRDGALTMRTVAIRTFQMDTDHELRLSAVTALANDSNGRVYIGDDGHGIFVHDEGTANFRHLPSTAALKVVDIARYDDKTLILSTFDKGFFLLDKATGSLREAPEPLRRHYYDNISKALAEHVIALSNGTLALVSNKISVFNPANGTVETCAYAPEAYMTPFFNNQGMILCLGINFIGEYDSLTGEARTVYRHKGRLSCAVFDGEHTVYLGTDSGLVALDMSSGTTRNLNSKGLGHISSLVLEEDRLWIGASNNLYLKELPSDNIMSFGRFDGVAANEYIPHATLVSDRYVYMGGVNGLMRIERDEIARFYAQDNNLSINLADIEVDGASAYKDIKNGCLSIASSHSTVRLSVIGDGDNAIHRQMYRFVIKGSSAERVFDTYDNFIAFSMLNQGETYDILAAPLRPDGESCEPRRLLTLSVMAPWYRSWWFIALLCASVLGGIVFNEVRRRRANNRRVAAQLEACSRAALEKEVTFLINTNHALRTPLTMIYAPVKMLLENIKEHKDVDLENELENIYRNTKRMRDVIDMAMELHQIGGSPEVTGTVRHEMGHSVREAVENSRAEIENKHLDMQLDVPDTLPVQLLAAPDRIRIVLDTLTRNAVRRSSVNGALAIHVRHIDDNMLRVEFVDRGPHLDDEILARLFSFHYADDVQTADNSIGLAYVRSIVETLGGRIGADNNSDGEGITVWMELPIGEHVPGLAVRKSKRSYTPPPAAPAPSEQVIANVDTSEMTVIVVEEDNDLCMFMSSQLSGHFRRVLYAFNGKDALIMIRQNQPDIVICSVLMPIKSGIELCTDIKSNPETSHIPVILLTTLKDGPLLESAYAAGADSYLSKPFDMNVLMMRLRNLLHNRSVMKQRYSEVSRNDLHRRQLPNADEIFLLKIDKIIADNIENPEFSVDSLADKMHSSRTVLYGKFKSITGKTIGAYINDYRLSRSKEMLRETRLSISEISEQLGFSSQRYFSTFFKERTGKSPSAFRFDTDSDSNNKQ